MNQNILRMYHLVQEIAWQFGSHGFDGECCGDLTLVEFMALKRATGHDQLTIQDLGVALDFTKSGATRVIDRLEKKGYVARQQSLLDGRVCCVVVTAKGAEVITRITEQYADQLEKKLRDLEQQEITSVISALETLVKSMR